MNPMLGQVALGQGGKKQESLWEIMLLIIAVPIGIPLALWYLDKTSPARRPARARR